MLDELIAFGPKIFFILEGMILTLQLSSISVLFGMVLGSMLSLCKISDKKLLRLFGHAYTSVFRGTPVIVQLSLIYFVLPNLIGLKFNVFTAGVITLSLNSAAYVSEIVRAGIKAVDNGQYEAAKALGITRFLCMKDIILPQALRNVMPALVNELINLIKESALISTIGGMDLMRRANVVSAETYNLFLPLMTAAAGYYVMVVIISLFAKFLERRLAL